MCRVCNGQSKQAGGGRTPGDNSLPLFDKCYGLFYVPTGTRDRHLNVPSEGQLMVSFMLSQAQELLPHGSYYVALWLRLLRYG